MDSSLISLRPSETGIVVSNRISISNKGSMNNLSGFGRFLDAQNDFPAKILISNPALNHQSLMTSLTFWDKVFWPVLDIIPFGDFARPNEFQTSLIEAEQLEIFMMPLHLPSMSQIEFYEGKLVSRGPQNKLILGKYTELLTELPKVTKSPWTFSSELNEFGKAAFRNNNRGFSFDLVNCIPIATDIIDVDDFARWREDRKVERRRFMSNVSSLAADLQNSETPETLLTLRLQEIRKIADDVVATGQEKGLSFELASRRFNFNLKNLEFKETLERFAHAGALPFIAGQNLAGVAAGSVAALQQSVSIRPAYGLSKVSSDLLPFLSVGQFVYSGK